YQVGRRGQVTFALGAYDTTRPLVIDPVVDYSSYLGGSAWDGVRALAVDAQGYRYVTGSTLSADFPVLGPIQGTLAGSYDVFVARLDPQGSALVHSTFLGGSGADQARGLAVDAGGNVHLAGVTESVDFPVQGAVQAAPGGGQDAFVAALSPSGAALVYSTYLGGAFHDAAEGLALASTGVVVVGWTESSDFPTERPLQPLPGGGVADAFVARLALGGSPLHFSTYLGGSNADRATAVAVDGGDVVHVGGVTLSADFPVERPLQAAPAGDQDAFLAGIEGTGARLRYSTYLGGSAVETLAAVAAGAGGAVYVAGSTRSADFPTRRGYQHGKSGPPSTADGFVAKVDTSASALVYATYLGGADHDVIGALAVDAGGHAHVTGETRSADFPLVHEVMERPGTVDAFVAKLDAAGRRLVFSTCFGGRLGADTGEALAVTADGAVHVGGRTDAPDLPLAGPVQAQYGGQGDAFLARIQPDAVTWDLAVDAAPTATSNGNGVLDLHEEVVASPAWRNDGPAPLTTTGAASSFAGPGGVYVTYSVEDNSADYGTLAPGQAVSCAATGDCFRLRLTSIALRRSFHWDAIFRELLSTTGAFVKWTVHVGETFLDVPRSSPYARYVETLVHRGVTAGCVAHGEIYCPTAPVTRADMAVVIAGARDRPRFVPASCASGPRLFADVTSSSPACPWIESLARRGVVAGCSGTHFCPDQVVTREQMAVLVLAALEGRHYRPPACTTPAFTDVPAASPYC
ncbi:MAG TPA: S-layer homology domain-containing protein, partial [Vicinamibacteria bacterium]|nr:S-layer homology domain-containing protein [Vicinamibacteria bacterium]